MLDRLPCWGPLETPHIGTTVVYAGMGVLEFARVVDYRPAAAEVTIMSSDGAYHEMDVEAYFAVCAPTRNTVSKKGSLGARRATLKLDKDMKHDCSEKTCPMQGGSIAHAAGCREVTA